jgi:hypothetical protein
MARPSPAPRLLALALAVLLSTSGEPAGAQSAALIGASAHPAAPADLSHPTFTATENLNASLVSPADGGVVAILAASIEVETVAGAGVELCVDGSLVPFSRIGKRSIDTKTGMTRYTYYGVPMKPGRNAVRLTPLGAGDLRGPSNTYTIFAAGPPASISVSASGPLRADGRSPDRIVIRALDLWKHPAATGNVVRVVLVSGDAHLSRGGDAAAAAAARPVPLPTATAGVVSNMVSQEVDVPLGDDGTAIVQLMPGMKPGAVIVRVDSAETSTDARFFLAPNLRHPFVTGLVTGGAGAVPGIPSAPDGTANGTASRRARIALFATGAIGRSLATLAYNSADTLQRTAQSGTIFGSDPADRPYAITGDASLLRDDALSRDRLYARFDTGLASFTWGEFRARTGPETGLGGFDQLVDGAKAEYDGTALRGSAFNATNDIGYDRRVFPPTGLAGGITLRPNIVVGSEVIDLASLDRRTGAILSETPLSLGVDYALQYSSGILTFINVPLPFDDNFNPQVIVVTYEYDSPGNAAHTVGGRAEASLGSVNLGVGYVNDSTGSGAVNLATEDISGKLHDGSWAIEHAASRGTLLSDAAGDSELDETTALTSASIVPPNRGSAFSGRLGETLGNNKVTVVFDQTSAGYNNPFGGLSTPGLLNEQVTFTHQYSTVGELAFDVSHQSNSGFGPTSAQTTAALRVRHQLGKRLTVHAALERSNASNVVDSSALAQASPVPASSATPGLTSSGTLPVVPYQSSTQAELGVDWRVLAPLDLSVAHIATLAGENDEQPTQTDAQLSYDLGKDGRVYARDRWSSAPIESFSSATQALTAPTNGNHAIELGVERSLGPATTLDTSYDIDQTANGNDVYAVMGIRERFKLGRVAGDGFLQHGTAAGAGAGDGFTVYGSSLTYGDTGGRFRASGQAELRTGDMAGFSLSLAAAGALSPDVSAFANVLDSSADGQSQYDDRVGLAWRPSRSDDGVTLLQFDRSSGTSDVTDAQSGVLSLEQVVRASSHTTLVGRLAYKLDGDSFYAAHSSLEALRLGQALGPRIDVGVEALHSGVQGIDGATSTALAFEGGIRVGDRSRFAVGYNFNGTADPSLSTTPTHRGFYTTFTSVLDRLMGWGRP